MARLLCVLAALASGASALRGTPPAATRRAICGAVASTLAAPLLSPAAARAAASGPDKKALQQVTDSAAALKKILKEKDAFAAGLNAGEFSLPVAISFPTFQKLEPAGLDMEAAVDYAEAYRNARDLVKLAKLTRQPVVVTTKEPGKPKVETTKLYSEVENSGLAPTETYVARALDELLGASLALDAAIAGMSL
mmetsp:Transcript_14915/g.25432  ORF Transcript_14915/g.25432 Transcript_14915/m.25432 type:complete len:194 (+) Transcript_14915:19-600(+)